MYRVILHLCVVFTVVLSFPAYKNNRRYNVDQESFKLYGEDSAAVLKRFRRSPEYLKILEDKKAELTTMVAEMSMQILFFYHKSSVQKTYGILPSTPASDHIDGTKKMKVFFRRRNLRRDEDPSRKPNTSAEKSKQNIHDLDNYHIFSSELSVAEKNSFRDLGFEMAGNVVHSIIGSMDSNADGTAKFTQLPGGGENIENNGKTEESTTEHPVTHEVQHSREDPSLRDLRPNRVADIMLLMKRKEKARASNKDSSYLTDSSEHTDTRMKTKS